MYTYHCCGIRSMWLCTHMCKYKHACIEVNSNNLLAQTRNHIEHFTMPMSQWVTGAPPASKVTALHPQALHRHRFIVLHHMDLRSRQWYFCGCFWAQMQTHAVHTCFLFAITLGQFQSYPIKRLLRRIACSPLKNSTLGFWKCVARPVEDLHLGALLIKQMWSFKSCERILYSSSDFLA